MDTLGGDVLGMIAESTGAPWIARQACRPMRAAVRVRAWPLASAVESPERVEAALRLGLDVARAVRAAFRGAEIETLDWLRRKRAAGVLIMHLGSPADAARRGHVELLRWWTAHISPTHRIDESLFQPALRGGHLKVARWLWDEAKVCDRSAIAQAVVLGGPNQLEILEWLFRQQPYGFRRDPTLCIAALTHGRLELLRWLRAHGYPWGDATCDLAVRANGATAPITVWATANGCPF